MRGHAQAQARLSRAIARDQLHHGLIFVGPSGVGKATLARGLGAALHCQVQPALGCGTCTSCRRIASGTHAGVEWLAPAEPGGRVKIEAARTLAHRLEMAPFEGNHHLVVFDPADAIGEAGFNAMLKTIEEPRPGVHFVMIVTGLDVLLPTILSRCLTVRVGRLDDADVAAIVEQQVATAETAPSAERIELAVGLAGGSAGLAVKLALDPSLDASLALLSQVVGAAQVGPAAIFGGDKSPLWQAWSSAVGPVKTGKPARERATLRQLCELWLLHLRERLRGREGLPGVPPGPTDPRAVLAQLDEIQGLLESIARNPNVRLSLEQTLLSLAA
ncbi:MAG: AAA family ATPase [bacterium]|nr:AAA family ATPase [bacterium]